jgi:hypothetical protein
MGINISMPTEHEQVIPRHERIPLANALQPQIEFVQTKKPEMACLGEVELV